MKITWIGHMCFKIDCDGGSVVIDPFQPDAVPGYKPYKETADLVLCTHQHFDHNYTEAVELSGKEPGFKVEVIPAFHDDKNGAEKGTNDLYIIDDGQFRVGHFGDLGHLLSEEQLAAIGHLDALMINTAGFQPEAADHERAAKVVAQVQPSIVFPGHYRTDAFGFEGSKTVSQFLDLTDFPAIEAGLSSFELDKKITGTCAVILNPSAV
ncbi:MAG: MBL fold metallo-hydrolase [Parasporobacterium sp.]|nr:MBL fold metallo-hydrolase [Parasporobacterium sp.]